MTPQQTEQLAAQARKRLADYISRMDAEQIRRMREQWSAKK